MSSDISEEIIVAPNPSVKRKRSSKEVEELEIDVNLPEPPSKKAKRKEKKEKNSVAGKKNAKPPSTNEEESEVASVEVVQPNADKPSRKAARLALNDHSDLLDEQVTKPAATSSNRSVHGVWIGNLPFTATGEIIRGFLDKYADIHEDDITRLHLPGPTKQAGRKQGEQSNRGFAYVDFNSKEATARAIAASEKLVDGRRLLIKDAKNFEGRPAKTAQNGLNGANSVGEEGKEKKAPSKRVFVGNLDFDVTRDDIFELFAPAGDVEDVFLATFEDSGKCKGFGWVRFASASGAEAAVKGFLYKEAVEDGDPVAADDSDVEIVTEKKGKSRRQKVWVNRIRGRNIRCEFAEDPQSRYKKRFGKEKPRKEDDDGAEAPIREVVPHHNGGDRQSKQPHKGKLGKEERRDERRKRHDARTIAPGKALANTQRSTGAIVAASGRKMTFD